MSRVKELGLERTIRQMYFVKNMSIRQIVKRLESDGVNLSFSAVQRFIKEVQLKNYDDTMVEKIVKIDDFNALSLVDNLFESAAQAARELSFTALVARELREEIAKILYEKGIKGLIQERELLEAWHKNTERMVKLSANVPKYIDTYNNLIVDTLDVQKKFSFVRLATEELKNLSPEMHKRIMDALHRDENALALMSITNPHQIRDYWKQRERRVLDAVEEDN